MTELRFRVEPSATPGEAPFELVERDGRVYVTVRLGERRTGGYSVAVHRITRSGERLVVSRIARAPQADAIVAQVLTAPAQTVSLEEPSVRGIRLALLVDETGKELARINA